MTISFQLRPFHEFRLPFFPPYIPVTFNFAHRFKLIRTVKFLTEHIERSALILVNLSTFERITDNEQKYLHIALKTKKKCYALNKLVKCSIERCVYFYLRIFSSFPFRFSSFNTYVASLQSCLFAAPV